MRSWRQGVLIDDGHAEFIGLGALRGPHIGTGHHVAGLRADAAAHFPPFISMASLMPSRLKLRKTPETTMVRPLSLSLVGAAEASATMRKPAARRRSTTSRLPGTAKKPMTLSAIASPTSPTPINCSLVAIIKASMLPKLRASFLATVSPTCRIPMANSTCSYGMALLASMPATTCSALFRPSPFPGRAIGPGERVRSATSLMSPAA